MLTGPLAVGAYSATAGWGRTASSSKHKHDDNSSAGNRDGTNILPTLSRLPEQIRP